MGGFPSGKCDSCGKIFERPNKYRTEEEGFHIYGCRLESIENAIKNQEEIFDILGLIEEVERISKVSSFGATQTGNEYNKRMLKCKKVIKDLREKFALE